jgi:hypothetical protein
LSDLLFPPVRRTEPSGEITRLLADHFTVHHLYCCAETVE